jgi:hypothetical protein
MHTMQLERLGSMESSIDPPRPVEVPDQALRDLKARMIHGAKVLAIRT